MNRSLILVAFVCFLYCDMAYAAITVQSSQPSSEQLSTLKKKISSLKQSLKQQKKQHAVLTAQLKQAELAINEARKQQRETESLLQTQQQQQQQLQDQQRALSNQLLQQRQQLTEQLQLAYLIDDPSFIRLLLDDTPLNENTRMMTYLRYLHHDQEEQLTELADTLKALAHNQDKQRIIIQSIQQAQKKQAKEYHTLLSSQKKQEALLSQLKQEITQKTTQLESLVSSQQKLEKIVHQLRRKKSIAQHAFAQSKGKLTLPTKGRVIERFGTPIGGKQLTLKGLLIEAPVGQHVHAISSGKVVFANWLKGFGLLMIIDHGDGFMTLYARNQSLFKEVGDIVSSNEVIAEVGRSGGYEKSGLYFEIRHRGYPKNPETWCRVRTVV